MREVRRLVMLAASRSVDVFVVGETGTGKELVARTIHAVTGAKGAFIRVDAASPPGELDSKLFGPKPAGTTIFLREVGDLAPALQPHLRRAIEERHSTSKTPFSHVRLIYGSTRDLAGAIRQGIFDEGLHQLLSSFVIELPTLHSRGEDIPLLVDHFLGVLKRDTGHQVEGFSPQALDVLMHRNWPGNVRELYDQVRTTVILSPANIIEARDLWPKQGDEPGTEPWHLGYRELRKRVLLRFESDFVSRVLKAAQGNVSMAARLAKIDRKHLWRLIQRNGIRLDRLDKNSSRN